MGKYFVIDFKKVSSTDEFNKVVRGHNLRNRQTSNNNIDPSKTKDNIILQDFKYKGYK